MYRRLTGLKPQHLAGCLFVLFTATSPGFADIYEWEYIDPLQPELGKQQSTTLVPDGVGVDPVPGAEFRRLDLTKAYFIGADLTGASFKEATYFNADFTNAIIAGAELWAGTHNGFTEQNLYQTQSYQNGILPGLLLGDSDLVGWDLSNLDLAGARLTYSDLTGASLQGSDLTDAALNIGTLDQADFSGTIITGAIFEHVTTRGFTFAQLQSTASYQAGDLSRITIGYGNDLAGWDFSNQNLTGANFHEVADLTGADFTGADIGGSFFSGVTAAGFSSQQLASTATYLNNDLASVRLSQNDFIGWDFSGQNLDGAYMADCDFTSADLTDAIINGADFTDARADGFTEQQFASTASYKSGDLTRLIMSENRMPGWDLSGLNLSDSDFEHSGFEQADLSGATLTGSDMTRAGLIHTDLSYADLSNVGLYRAILTGTNLIGADLTGSPVTRAYLIGTDTRRAIDLTDEEIQEAWWIKSLIWPDGTARVGLTLEDDDDMWIYDDDGGASLTPIPIAVQTAFDIDPDARLRFLFEDDAWGSTISFDPSVGTAYLGGTLELSMKLDDGLSPGDLLGTTFDLFDWDGVTIDGAFDAVVLDPAWYAAGLSIDLSQLMTTGEVRVVPLIGDLDGDGFVGITDLNTLLANWNQHVIPGNLLAGDMNGDGFVGIEDLNGVLGTWNAAAPPPASVSGAAIPEPGGAVLLGIVGMALSGRCNRRPAG
jgi:uncharacterized protein YjbI with pentapeptide repeats